jgi:hypothetical protein
MRNQSSSLLVVAWVLALAAAAAVYVSASRRRTRYGEAPAGVLPVLWAVVVALLALLGLCFYGLAVLGQDRRASR